MVMGIARIFLKVVLIILCFIPGLNSLCEVETGDAGIILDIAESRANQTDQSTYPATLPINGNNSTIRLEIIADSENIFQLVDKQLKLKRPLDRDAKDISFIQVQIRCTVIASNFQRTIPVTLRVIDINDNVPQFVGLPYEVSISELSPIGATVFSDLKALDDDSSINALIEYFIRPGNGSEVDGYEVFSIDFPHQGIVTLKQPVDYERVNVYEVVIVAVDRAGKGYERLSSTATLTVHVTDADDQDPAFVFQGCSVVGNSCVNPEYSAEVVSGKLSGILKLWPEDIKAKDQDKINSIIIYSFSAGIPENYLDYFVIDSDSAVIKQIKRVDRHVVKNFSIVVKAEEVSENRRFATAKLSISVRAADARPPILTASSLEGFVDEHSRPGTAVTVDKLGKKGLRFTIDDPDLMPDDPKPVYVYELTSNKFRINNDGYLVVEDSTLDRDPPNPEKYVFQVIGRVMEEKVASVPLSITVHLNDVNDNDPEIDIVSPITVAPYTEPVPTQLTHLYARDSDAGENAEVTYSLYHVSNDGQKKFRVNKSSGVLESTGPLEPGQNYSLTVQAADSGGRISHRILDVYVASTETPVRPTFSRHLFEIQLSEGVAVGSVVLSFNEDDSSNQELIYDIVEGNDDGSFLLSPVTGILSVRKPLDREKSSRYSLLVKATNKSGQTSNATVNVDVTDINDCNPEFVGQPYIFYVDEGLANAVVGRVQAVDQDDGPNGLVRYLMPLNSPFRVDFFTGEIRTKIPLDYEHQHVEYTIITAKDGAAHPRIATATITVMVNDIPDEVPIFPHKHYDGSVPENMANMDILQVSAIDPDSYEQMTYIIRDGPYNRFSVDPASGVVHTLWPLDYEEQSFYMLIIGTRENYGDEPNATCIVRITVIDRNDNPPTFTSVPPPVTIQDDLSPGSAIGTVIAIDSDGMPPNNLVRYTLLILNWHSYQNYFDIDHDTGVITLKGDLSRERSTEFKLEVRAYDLGSPQLTSSTTIDVHVYHSTIPSFKMDIAFPDASYTVEIEENALGNTAIKTLPIINKPSQTFLFYCDIKRGNDLGHFHVVTKENGDCELRTKGQKLDYETKAQYKLVVVLLSNYSRLDPERTTSEIIVNVKDTNDNAPVFQYYSPTSKLIGRRYVASLPREATALTPFAKVDATDNDSGAFGEVVFHIDTDSDPEGFFVIDPGTGIVSSSRTFENVNNTNPAFKLKIVALDQPLSEPCLNSSSLLAVNLLSDDYRLILVLLNSTPEKVAEKKTRIIETIQDFIKMAVSIEKIESRKFLNSSKELQTDPSSTDVWFHAFHPETLQIMNVNEEQLNRFISNELQQRSLLFTLSTSLELSVDIIRVPFKVDEATPVPVLPPAKIQFKEEMDGFQAALIALACIIGVFGTVGIIYICFIWSRFAAYNKRLKKLALAPRYEPVLVEPNLKPYETQVLQMNVHLDDSSSLEDSPPAGYKRNLDSVSYITRDTGDGSTLVMGNASFTESDSFEGGESILLTSRRKFVRDQAVVRDTMSPAQNPVYHSSDEYTSSPIQGFAKSPKRVGDHIHISPVATTTEL